jgi:hypothetical protein
LLDAIVRRCYNVAAFANTKLTDDCLVGAAENTDNFSFGTPFSDASHDVHQRAVAIHSFVCFFGGEKDVALKLLSGRIGNKKTEAVAMNG